MVRIYVDVGGIDGLYQLADAVSSSVIIGACLGIEDLDTPTEGTHQQRMGAEWVFNDGRDTDVCVFLTDRIALELVLCAAEVIETVAGTYPMVMVRIHKHAVDHILLQLIGIARVGLIVDEALAGESGQTEVGRDPKEILFVKHNVRDACTGQPLRCAVVLRRLCPRGTGEERCQEQRPEGFGELMSV